MTLRTLLLCLLSFFSAVVWSSPPSAAQNPLGQGQIGPSQSRIVIYSAPDSTLPGTASIFVNGSYHASIVRGTHSHLCYAPGKVEVGLRQVRDGANGPLPFDAQTTLDMVGGQTYYIHAQAEGGRPQLSLSAPGQAHTALTATRLQAHTVSRVAQECIELVADPLPRPVPGGHAVARPGAAP